MQLADSVAEFAHYLADLAAALDATEGWYGVFVRRDPEGLRDCLEGREVPPWDVVESLLHDLAGRRGEPAAREAGTRARQLHAAAVAAYDALRPDPAALHDRLDAMYGELRYATRRERDLRAALQHVTTAAEADRLTGELAWARDDVVRARSRVRELQVRIEHGGSATPPAEAGGGVAPAPAAGAALDAYPAPEAAPADGPRRAAPAPEVLPTDEPGPTAEPEPAERVCAARRSAARKRPRGARFAGLELPEEDEEYGGEGGGGAPDATAAAAEDGPGAAPAPRGARFAGAYEDGAAHQHAKGRDAASAPVPSPETRRAVVATVADLAALRAEGRSGEAHALLCAAAGHPAGELPFLAAELERQGLAAEVPTLLWEVACLPPAQLTAAADALAAAGRVQDCASLLRQGVARPAEEVAGIALTLCGAGRRAEARELLTAFVKARTSREAAGLAGATDDPDVLVPLLLAAAAEVSAHCRTDLAHALRMADVPDHLIGPG